MADENIVGDPLEMVIKIEPEEFEYFNENWNEPSSPTEHETFNKIKTEK